MFIQRFYKQYGRIPFKKEYLHEKAMRTYFGSWNNAIIAAGFTPNPVRFAHKYIAKDGHKCDSMAEKIIDDWLYLHKIEHTLHPKYPETKFTSDFKVRNIFIEFFGLHGQFKKYDMLMKEKLNLIKSQNIQCISIYPEDLFPSSKLDIILGIITNNSIYEI